MIESFVTRIRIAGDLCGLTDHKDPRMMSAGNICALKGVKSFLANSVRKSNGTGVRKSIGAKMMTADKYIWYLLCVFELFYYL